MVDNVDIKEFFIKGFIISFVFTCFVFASLYLNPWLWFEDYPEDIREMVANPPDYQIQKIIVGLMGIVIIVGMIVQSSFKWTKKYSPNVTFIHVFIYVFLMYQIVNLWDLIVIDWLIFTWITPEFVVIPGTEGAEGYNNYLFHFKAGYLSLGSWVGSIGLATLVALLSIPTRSIFIHKFKNDKRMR